MPKRSSKNPAGPRRTLLEPDADALAMLAAAITAAAVMILHFLRGGGLGFDTGVRIALTFVVTYVAVFFLSRFVMDMLQRELGDWREKQRASESQEEETVVEGLETEDAEDPGERI